MNDTTRPAPLNPPSAQILADTFSALLLRAIGRDNINECIERNIAEKAPGVCHSHDYCDANEVMTQAFQEHGIEHPENEDPQLWCEAWTLAMNALFAVPQYRCEFLDFDHLPGPLPAGFEDVSWHNDSSPSFQFGTGNTLYINYETPALREYEAAFFVLTNGEDGDTRTVYCGDDFTQALRVAMQPTLEQGTRLDDEGQDVPALGFVWRGVFIANPRMDEGAAAQVDPATYYGLSAEQVAQIDKANA